MVCSTRLDTKLAVLEHGIEYRGTRLLQSDAVCRRGGEGGARGVEVDHDRRLTGGGDLQRLWASVGDSEACDGHDSMDV